jgi:sialate O-acetylesterase
MNRKRACLFLAALAAAAPLAADVRLPALIGDNMVLQSGVPVRIWGKADAGERVTVKFRSESVSTVADASGKWAAYLSPMRPGGPFEMTISGKNSLTLRNVLIGEVWVGSGQSNMAWLLSNANNAEQEIAQANYPRIRLFNVKRVVADAPLDDVEGSWQECTPDSAKATSAVGYFFSRNLHLKLGVPVGFIHSSWGGTPAQSWTSRAALEDEPALKFILEDWQKTLENYPSAKEKYDKQLAAWKEAAAKAKAEGRTPPQAPRPPAGPGHQNTPGGLYNAMVAPLTPYAIRGAIWYQGESNANERHAYPYRKLFRLMIEDWRKAWGQGSFPFLFVQLANFKANPWWPVLRESQVDALELRNTGMAVIIDIGESKDIHPRNKQDVGLRLSLAARAIAYGEKLVYSGPMYRQMTTEGNRIRLWFDFVGAGLEARGGGPLKGFMIAGPDGNFVPADARIEGETVVVSSPAVSNPVAVRYAWEDDPVCNLFNKDGLPASPFRTDRGKAGQ